MSLRWIAVALGATACVVTFRAPVAAGTTGGIQGRAVEGTAQTPIADASVSANSPSQTATAVTDASGHFAFISLGPDTYTVTASKSGYTTASVPGVTVFADQTRSVTLVMQRAVRSLGTVTVRGSESLVRPGTTSNVFSVNAAGQKATAALAGSGGLNQAYGAIAAAPGVVFTQGQQGWYQSVYVRGGDNDQTAYELDGIPVMRVSDSAPVSTLSNLGQQEVQVYTGGTPASAEAMGIAGYVNQVIRTGTYPGFGDVVLGIGNPTLYNKFSTELGGATPDRRFSYYVGVANAVQDFRYADQNNGVSNPLYFFPMSIGTPLNGTVYDGNTNGGANPVVFAPGPTYAIGRTFDEESIANFHFGIPHGSLGIRDDVQLLYVYSNLTQKFFSSLNDLGLNTPAALNAIPGNTYPMTYFDIPVYAGQVFAAPDPSKIITMLFPNTGTTRGVGSTIPFNEREGSQNGMALVKLQYQHNFDSKSYLRLYGGSNYNWWFITGPVSANLPFGDQLPDYEVIGHNWSGAAVYSRQMSDKHLLNATVSYMTGKLQTYSMGFFDGFMTNLVDPNGLCYEGLTGTQWSCYDTTNPNSRGTAANLMPATAPALSPAAVAGATWLITENGQNAQVDNVKPAFSAASITDQWRPSDKLTFNLGLRLESFKYTLDDLTAGYPARAFWFKAYNNEFCFGPGQFGPVSRFDPVAGVFNACPAGTTPANLTNFGGGTVTDTVYQPRIAFTYAVSQDTVFRGSYGRYARPAPTSYLEFNTIQQNLPAFTGSFLSFGYNSPFHETHADIANNYDLSIEHHFPNTDISVKLTPYLRVTKDQIQYLSLNAQGVVDGLNVGQQRSSGIEFALTKGSFSRDGLALLLSLTTTNSRIHYTNFPNGRNLVDLLNDFVRQYNGFTSACAASTSLLCTANGIPSGNAVACFDGTNPGTNANIPTSPDPTCSSLLPVANPYFNNKPQPLFDRNGDYTTYDQIPAPFNNALGFAVPFQSSLVVNYKHGRFNVTPSLTYSSGSSYGSPLVWPGYDPSTCSNVSSGTVADPQTCSGFIFTPDKYTGNFDTFGAFKEPSRLTGGISIGYELSAHVNATLTVANLVDTCYQHGRPWDSPTTCIYAQLPSNLLAPAGNFSANPPIQLAFPYGSWYNNIEIGQEGQKSPPQAVFQLHFKM